MRISKYDHNPEDDRVDFVDPNTVDSLIEDTPQHYLKLGDYYINLSQGEALCIIRELMNMFNILDIQVKNVKETEGEKEE